MTKARHSEGPRPNLSRRRLIGALALLPLVVQQGGCTRGNANGQALVNVALGDPAAAARLGSSFLADNPAEADAERLWHYIEKSGRLSVAGPMPVGGEPLLAWFKQLVRAEYAAGRARLVDGWLLSPSEARLYALSALFLRD
ncbi:MAG: hypothetical protein ABFS23_01190 [Pseudomonadota bacterium]